MGGYVGITMSYTPVEYIESSGTQYIDTGFKMSNNTKIKTKLSMTANNIMTAVGVSGSYQSFSIQTYNGNYRVRWRSGTTSNIQVDSTIPAVLTTPHVIEANSTNAKIDGTVIGNTNSYTFTETSNLFIFAMSSNNTAINNAIGRIYYYKIYNGSTLVRDFIPAVDQDNVACLYDLVEGKFYYNQGTGSFMAGNTTGSTVIVGDKARKIVKAYVGIPTSYTPVEYIESSGTQYIDTGLTQNGYHSVLDVSFTNFTNLQIITGTYGPNDNQRYYTRINTNGSLVTQFGGYSGNNLITGPTLTANTRYIINTKLFNGAQNLTVNGTSYGSQTIAGQTFPQANIYLLAIWSDSGAGNNATCKLYGAKYYDSNNTLTRDFIPAVDQDNVACLYEQVEGKFYYNKGTGTFTAGSETGQAVSLGSKARNIIKGYVGVNGVARLCFQLAAYTELEYIESTGTQWIETGVVFTPGTKSQLKFTASAVTGDALYGFGTINDNTDYRFFNYRNRFYFDVPGPGQEGARIYGGSLSLNTIYEIELGNFYIKNLATGTNIVSSSTQNFTNTSNTLKMWYKDGNISKGKLYYLKIWSGATLQRDFIPVLDSDNIPCLYDKVEGKFYYNKGTGTFGYRTANNLNLLNNALLMNTGSLVGMGDRAELSKELTDNNVGDIEQVEKQVKQVEDTKEVTEDTKTTDTNTSGDTK